MREPSGIVLAGEAVGIAGAVPALVVVQHPVRHRLDAEALEHPVGDLRVALDDEPFGARQLAGLLEDLFRDRELAEVVQAAGEARQLDLGRRAASSCSAIAPAIAATRSEWLPV